MSDCNRFIATIDKLKKFYGRPVPPKIKDPLELILLENVAYLADEDQRNATFAALKKKVGTRPGEILKATQANLKKLHASGELFPRCAPSACVRSPN